MKRNVFVFLSTVFLSLLIVPVINILNTPNRDAIKWTAKSFLYNMDFASRWMARLLYPLGISTDPKQVIIGRDGWLYLGDQYEQTRTVDRQPPSNADLVLAQEIGRAAEAWDVYLASKGVKLFRVMIGPNKGSVYPEYLPVWAKPSSPNATDALLAGTGTTYYVDLRGALTAAKSSQQEPLYYKTDTHWNQLGAGVAFRAFSQQISLSAPDIKWPSPKIYKINRVDLRSGGDLANFIRLTPYLSEHDPMLDSSILHLETRQSDFDTKQILYQGNNQPVSSPSKPILVQSAGALNKKRVLWLRDSFGTALSQLMAVTFSEVLQLHWGEAIKPEGRFVQLVEDWKPDYVFFTVVERASRAPWFANYPPPVIGPKADGFKPIQTTNVAELNHLKNGATTNDFQITGVDPFVDYAISKAVPPSEVRFLNINLTCADDSQSIPLQLFWLEDGNPYFDEEHSARFSIQPGDNLIDLRTIPKLSSEKTISRIRVDIDDQSSCTHFKLNNPVLGVNNSKH